MKPTLPNLLNRESSLSASEVTHNLSVLGDGNMLKGVQSVFTSGLKKGGLGGFFTGIGLSMFIAAIIDNKDGRIIDKLVRSKNATSKSKEEDVIGMDTTLKDDVEIQEKLDEASVLLDGAISVDEDGETTVGEGDTYDCDDN